MNITRSSLLSLLLSLPLLVSACGDDEKEEEAKPTVQASEIQPVVEAYSDMVLLNYEEALSSTQAHMMALDTFVATPNAANFKAAKDTWLAARDIYGQSEGFRFYDGPIDDENGPEGQINAWPMDEVFVDYTIDAPTGGLVNDTTFMITAANISAKNGEGNEEANVSSGYHAIEFLLWGQDLDANGPGARPLSDFEDGGTAANQDRRRQYLKVTGEMLIADLTSVRDQWKKGEENYRKGFTSEEDPRVSLTKMIKGMGELSGGELSGERMEVALKNKDQEDEHSCFSDNTHNDIIANAQSIQNIYLGNYGSFDGPGIDTLVEKVDPELNAQLKGELAKSIQLAKEIPVPFDQALLSEDGQKKIQATIDALRAQTATISKAADALGVKVNFEEEE